MATTAMTKEHKAALAAGRESSRAVGRYLDALDETKPKRGRKADPKKLRADLEQVEKDLPEATGIRKLELAQRKIDLGSRISGLESATGPDLKALEKEFVKHAAAYSERKGISYAAWRAAGVEADVLKKAGVAR